MDAVDEDATAFMLAVGDDERKTSEVPLSSAASPRQTLQTDWKWAWGREKSRMLTERSVRVSWIFNPNQARFPQSSRKFHERQTLMASGKEIKFRDEEKQKHDTIVEPAQLDNFFEDRDKLWKQNDGIPKETLEKTFESIRAKKARRIHPCAFVLLSIFPGILFLVLSIFCYVMLWVGQLLVMIQLTCGTCQRDMFDLGATRQVNHCVLTHYANSDEDFDFGIHRTPTYFWPIAFSTMYHFYEWLTGNAVFDGLTDEEMLVVMMCTCVSRDIVLSRDEHDELVARADFTERGLRKMTFFKNHHFDVNAWNYNYKTKKQSLEMNRRKIQPKVVESTKDKEKWACAKAHFGGLIGFWNSIITHNWVHFHFLDIACSSTKTSVPENSVVGKILYTHLRFTPPTNRAGPGMKSNLPQGSQSFVNKLRLWKGAPISHQQVLASIAENSVEHYIQFGSDYENEMRTNQSQWAVDQAFPPVFVRQRLPRFARDNMIDSLIDGRLGAVPEEPLDKDGTFRSEDIFSTFESDASFDPEDNDGFYDPKMIGLIPYCDMLSEYYEICYDFMYQLFSRQLIELDILKNWMRTVQSEGMPKLMAENPVDVLATLIWTAGIVHSMDHISHSDLEHLVFMSTTARYKENQTAEEILTPPAFSYAQWQHAKSKTFMDWYIKYRPSWWLDDLIASEMMYGNWLDVSLTVDEAKTCRVLSDEFRAHMLKLNERWRWICDVQKCPYSVSF